MPLAVRNLARNSFRVALTAVGVAVAIVAFLLLRTVLSAWASRAEFAAKDRVVTRHKVTFVMSLPKRYAEDVGRPPRQRAVPSRTGSAARTRSTTTSFSARSRSMPTTYFSVYDEMNVAPQAIETWKHDRQGAIVGDVLATKLGWKVGDRIALESGISPAIGS